MANVITCRIFQLPLISSAYNLLREKQRCVHGLGREKIKIVFRTIPFGDYIVRNSFMDGNTSIMQWETVQNSTSLKRTITLSTNTRHPTDSRIPSSFRFSIQCVIAQMIWSWKLHIHQSDQSKKILWRIWQFRALRLPTSNVRTRSFVLPMIGARKRCHYLSLAVKWKVTMLHGDVSRRTMLV